MKKTTLGTIIIFTIVILFGSSYSHVSAQTTPNMCLRSTRNTVDLVFFHDVGTSVELPRVNSIELWDDEASLKWKTLSPEIIDSSGNAKFSLVKREFKMQATISCNEETDIYVATGNAGGLLAITMQHPLASIFALIILGNFINLFKRKRPKKYKKSKYSNNGSEESFRFQQEQIRVQNQNFEQQNTRDSMNSAHNAANHNNNTPQNPF